MTRRLSTQGLTEGAIQAALVAVFALATRYVPVIGLATAFLVPLPLIVLTVRRGLPPAVLAAAVAGIIAGTLSGSLLLGVGILVTVAPLALTVGLGARRGWTAARILGAAFLVTAVSMVINLGLILAFSGVSPLDEMNTLVESMRQGQEASLALYRRLGINPPGAEEANRQMAQLFALMPKLLPTLLLLGALVSAWLNFQVARPIMGRLGHPLPALPPARTWRIPGFVLWLLPLAFVLVALGERQVVTLSDRLRSTLPRPPVVLPPELGLNVMFLVQTTFAVQGVLVTWVLLGRYTVPAIRILLLAFFLFNPFFSMLILILGLADSAFPLRERFGPRPVLPEAPA